MKTKAKVMKEVDSLPDLRRISLHFLRSNVTKNLTILSAKETYHREWWFWYSCKFEDGIWKRESKTLAYLKSFGAFWYFESGFVCSAVFPVCGEWAIRQNLKVSADRGAAAGGREQQELWCSIRTSWGLSWPHWCRRSVPAEIPCPVWSLKRAAIQPWHQPPLEKSEKSSAIRCLFTKCHCLYLWLFRLLWQLHCSGFLV